MRYNEQLLPSLSTTSANRSSPFNVLSSRIKPMEPTAPIHTTQASGNMYPHVAIEMPPYKETVNNAQQQAPPYPGPYDNQQRTPPYPVPYDNQQQAIPTLVQPQVIVVQQSSLPPLGSRSVHLTCPTCKTDIQTSVTANSTGCAYIWCLALMCFVCWLCSCIPLCMDRCKVFNHTCPNCKAYIGTYRP